MKTSELCKMLAQTIEQVKSNEIDVGKAQAIVGLSNGITRQLRLQLDYNRMKTTNSKIIEDLE